MPVKVNRAMINSLGAYFQRRYEPNFSWVNAVSAALLFPELRAFWPSSSVDESGNAYDLSGQGRILSNSSTTTGVAGLAPYIDFIAASNTYLFRADEKGLDCSDGLTLFSWTWFDAPAIGADTGILTKWQTTSADRCYTLYKTAANKPTFSISSDGGGVNVFTVAGTASIAAGAWHFLAGRFTASAELALYDNGVWATNIVGIPAGIFDGAGSFLAGAGGGGTPTLFLDGRMSLFGICAYPASNAIIEAYYQQTRAMFGVT
jgi:hypothetical protein